MKNDYIYVSARDVAENAKLNHEIAKELRKYTPNHSSSSSGLTRGRSAKQLTLRCERRHNETCYCETAEAVETTAKSELSRWLRKFCLTWISVSHPQGGARITVERKFWMPYRKGFALRGMTVLFLLACFPSISQAEQCTPTPDCKSLGYTETSCPDGGVKCPWNTSLMYCCKKCEDKPQAGLIGEFYYCEGQIVGIRVPGQSFAIAMNDAPSTMNWNSAESYCTGYRFCGTGTIGRLPTKDELFAIHDNITYLQEQLQKNGGQQFNSYFWSSSPYGNSYWVVHPVSGHSGNNGNLTTNHADVRPVLGL